VTPDELKSARKSLTCTTKELANVLGVEQNLVLAWERGEFFPTKQYIDKITALVKQGPSSVPKKSKSVSDPMQVLADPQLWEVLRKLLVHKKLRDDVVKLASGYAEPHSAE
jgi:transcriptional regulator with XRE-family HTH domain